MELIGAKTYGEATAGIPCYQPIVAEYIRRARILSWTMHRNSSPATKHRRSSLTSMPDRRRSGKRFNVRVIEKGEDVATVIKDSMALCQKAVDDMWEQYDSLQ